MKTFLSLVVAVLIMTACNNNNKKPGGGALDGVDKPNTPKVTGGGGWSTADQQKFL
ncbi:MAG: hypothetical protein JST10_11785, partial [Bacteroidetes bacterium]|nr:hypothetical protein [Bacteroidota bacterium]